MRGGFAGDNLKDCQSIALLLVSLQNANECGKEATICSLTVLNLPLSSPGRFSSWSTVYNLCARLTSVLHDPDMSNSLSFLSSHRRASQTEDRKEAKDPRDCIHSLY